MKHKYPRTFHFPWSLGVGDDDKVEAHNFNGRRVVVTEKMDGENTSLYSDHMHARSLDSAHHWTRDWVKQWWASMRHDIPENWRVCGENMYARHSIAYHHLPSYFLGFSVWNDGNVCLDWDSTLEWFDLLGVSSVPVLYVGPWDEDIIRGLWTPAEHNVKEGYVVRPFDAFRYEDFQHEVRKFVRPNHVTTSGHWKHSAIVANQLGVSCTNI